MTSSPASWVWLARIRRPQGRKGEVFAEILTDFPEKFAERRHLWLLREAQNSAIRGVVAPASAGAGVPAASQREAGESAPDHPSAHPAELLHHWLHKGGVVLHFAGVDSISAAEALSGLYVAIPYEQRTPLPEGEAYIGDLIGCQLIDVAGQEPAVVGEIEDVDRSAGPTPLLIVHGSRGEVMIPFAKSYLRRLDIEGRRIEMVLPAGLVDLNIPAAGSTGVSPAS